METDVILKFRREKDNWICAECDMENDMSDAKCFACGYRRTPSDWVLRKWTEADERPTAPPRPVAPSRTAPPSSPLAPPTGSHETPLFRGPAFEEKAETESKNNGVKIIIGIIIGVIIICILIGVAHGSSFVAYSKAMREFDNGNYETAKVMFEKLPQDYRDVAYMKDESIYQQAMQCLYSEDFTTAESLFESISYHNDSADMVNECKYQEADSLYSDGYYIQAMEKFNNLYGYKDSYSMFYRVKSRLIEINDRQGYCEDEYAMEGHWSDESGNYVTYTTKSDGGVNSAYNLPHTDGTYFKVTDGVHYHGDDTNGWTEQWIFQQIDYYNADVYDFIDGTVYTLSRK